MVITLLCIGKLRERFLKDAENYYLKRLQRFTTIKVNEIEDDKRVNEILKKCDYLVVLDEKGKQLTSGGFASFIQKQVFSQKNLCFVIGGWEGVGDELKKEADFVLSLSTMTFPYQLARIIFLEQLYRAFTIIKGIDYHK
ncbi:MAG TPA: 23S rRNA (pseudouridine(1915)-N(3))-methyltransferase RlmH [Thermoplasmatales archaeon]|nr:23S rRNA (pseudouridine(1915)-N(3))-methyltransferase RlmH [Thermoplasmatales archaeon]